MTTYNKEIYGRLLLDVLPSSIDSDEEYDRIESIFNNLFNKKKLSLEEERLFHLLADLLEDYGKKVSGEIPPITPRELLSVLMKDNGLKQTDLAGIFGTQSIVSEVLNGKREITKSQAKALAEKFAMKLEAFI
ncbi:MAG TPA: helix-turn-helix domain-containing protein [Pyrinomonadaceae bacterium]|nr:helix-turn-helix domain-containing protein [Pyrinomonadaceae bacterium]